MEFLIGGSLLCASSVGGFLWNSAVNKRINNFLSASEHKTQVVKDGEDINKYPDYTLLYIAGNYKVHGSISDKFLQIDLPDQPIVSKKVEMYQYKDNKGNGKTWSTKHLKNNKNPTFPTTNNIYTSEGITLNGFTFDPAFIQRFIPPREQIYITERDLEKVPLPFPDKLTHHENQQRYRRDRENPSWENKVKYLWSGILNLKMERSDTVGDMRISYFGVNKPELGILGCKFRNELVEYRDDNNDKLFEVVLNNQSVSETYTGIRQRESTRFIFMNVLLGCCFVGGLAGIGFHFKKKNSGENH